MRAVWVLAGILIAECAAAAKPFATVTMQGPERVDGEARWTDSLWREGFGDCSIAATLERNEKSHRATRDNCVSTAIMIRNDSPRAIQCRVTIDVPSAANARARHAEALHVVMPGTQTTGVHLVGRAEDVPTAFNSECRIVPPSPLARVEIPANCNLKLKQPPQGDYYPWAAIDRGETGDSVVEFKLDPGSGQLLDPMIVASSGYAALDNATLDMVKKVRGTADCPGQSFRFKVKYRVYDGPPPPDRPR